TRQAPAEAGEAVVVAVEGDPFAAGFDGEGGVPGIGGEVSPGVGLLAEAGGNGPVWFLFAGFDRSWGKIINGSESALRAVGYSSTSHISCLAFAAALLPARERL